METTDSTSSVLVCEEVKMSDTVTNDVMEEDLSSSLYSVTLLDLPWEQVLCRNILPYVSIPQLFRLRAASHSSLHLVETYFSLQFHLNICRFGKDLTPRAFSLMTSESTCLKTLNLRGAKYGLTDDGFLPVISNNSRLEKIDISGCISLSGRVVYSIGVKCSRLKHLILRDCSKFTDDNFLSFLCARKPLALEHLDISGCCNLGDELVIKLVQCCPNLKYLLLGNLSGLSGLSDQVVCAIAHSCPHLMSLSLCGCWRVTDYSIGLIAAYCSKLKLLHVKGCRDVTEKSLGPLRQKHVKIDKAAPPTSYLNRLEHMNCAQRINVML